MKTADAKKRINGYLNVDYFTKSNAIIDQSYCLFLNGPWGIGKSYLVKEIIQNRSKTDLSDVKIAYFSQELTWEDPTLTALDVVLKRFPVFTVREARKGLSHFGITAKNVL